MILMTVFVACDKNGDDNSNNPNNPSNPNNPNNPDNPNNPTVKLVSYIIINGDILNYNYDAQNRLTSAVFHNNDTLATYTYVSANTIHVVWEGKKRILTLNSDGYIIKDQTNHGDYLFEYENDYLKKSSYNNNGKEESSSNFVWENGNLISEQYKDEFGSVIRTETYSYGTIPYKATNISPCAMPMMEYDWILPTSYFGKRTPQYLVSSIVINSIYEYENGKSSSYRYETNANGYVTKVYVKEDTQEEELWYEIKYK